MANVNITVGLQGLSQIQTGIGSINRSLAALANTGASVGRSLGSLQGAFGVFAGGALLKNVIGTADAYTLLGARLNVVSTSAANNARQMEAVFQIAQDARVPLDAVGKTYARIALNTERLGITQGQVALITSTLSKALAISGATAEEAAGSMTQFTQALSKGKFDGDELRSVFENMPPVVKALEEATGKTRGELYKLAAQGKITAELMLGALFKAGISIDEAFGKMGRTVGQSAVQLSNAWEKMIGEANAGQGAVGGFTEAMDNLRKVLSDPEFASAMRNFLGFLGRVATAAANAFKDTFGDDAVLRGFKAQLESLVQIRDDLLNEAPGAKTRMLLGNLFGGPSSLADVEQRIQDVTAAIKQMEDAKAAAFSSGHPDPTAYAAAIARAKAAQNDFNTTIAETTELKKKELAQLGLDEAGWAEHTTVIYGAAAAYANLRAQLEDWTGIQSALKETQALTTSMVSEFSSSVADMVVTGENKFKELLTSIEKMIVQFLVKQAVMMFLQVILGAVTGGVGTAASGGILGAIGGLFGFAQGGMVKGYAGGGPVGTDTTLGWLTPGEMVINRRSTQKHRALLESINADRYASGGMVGGGASWGSGHTNVTINAVAIDDISASRLARKMDEKIQKANRRRYGRGR